MKPGDRITVTYDPRPIGKMRHATGVVEKVMPRTGNFRVKFEDPGLQRDWGGSIYMPGGRVRGWGTLTWSIEANITTAVAEGIKNHLFAEIATLTPTEKHTVLADVQGYVDGMVKSWAPPAANGSHRKKGRSKASKQPEPTR